MISPAISHPSASPLLPFQCLASPPAEEIDLKSTTSPNGTHGQTIEDISLSGSQIDDLFQMYASHSGLCRLMLMMI